jgi:hypothetical protein
MRIAMGMLCYNRPIHTALSIAFAMHNKAECTDFFAFYGIHKDQQPPSPALDSMLKDLNENCKLDFFYMGEDKPSNVQGNVDTLMGTLSSLPGYSCFCKIDDDVLIGKGSDIAMGGIITAMESENVMLLMGQAVPEHMRRSNPFSWEARVNNYRVVQRAQRACPMETYTFVSMKCLKFLRDKGMSISCENARGTFGPYTRKITNSGGRVCLVLAPAVIMQHIGLTTTIEANPSVRSWAPARSWDPMDQVINLPGFDFPIWDASHKTSTQKQFALETINGLLHSMPEKYKAHIAVLLKHIEAYAGDPVIAPAPLRSSSAVPPPPAGNIKKRNEPVFVPRTSPGTALRKLEDGRVVRTPGPVRRVVIRQPA